MLKATTIDLKKNNMRNILQFVYHKRKTTKLEIATQLQISRPTVNQCIKELEEKKIVEKNGYFDSTGGRKAYAISMVSSAKIAIGLELLKDGYEVVALNLYGEIMKSEKYRRDFINNDDYYNEVCESINKFIASLRVSSKRILGVGIVLQGLISSDGNKVTYGKILNCTGLMINKFTEHISLPCRMFHDAESAATVELWNDETLRNAIFFHIRTNLSGALIINGKFLRGNQLKSGVFEHMTIVPDGTDCYCGKKGCLDCYCSYPVLLGKYKTLDDFFVALRQGAEDAASSWHKFLYYLSIGIDNLHMFIDYDIILGGTLAAYLTMDDVLSLHKMVTERSAFPTSQLFIKIAQYATTPISAGAAIPFLRNYLDSVVDAPFNFTSFDAGV